MKNSNQYSEKKLPLYDAAFERLRSDMLTTYYDDFVVVENYIMHKSFVSQWELYDYKYDTDPNDPAYYDIDFDGIPSHIYEKGGTKVNSNTYTEIYGSIRFITNPILLELFEDLLPVWNNASAVERVEKIEEAYRLKIYGEDKTKENIAKPEIKEVVVEKKEKNKKDTNKEFIPSKSNIIKLKDRIRKNSFINNRRSLHKWLNYRIDQAVNSGNISYTKGKKNIYILKTPGSLIDHVDNLELNDMIALEDKLKKELKEASSKMLLYEKTEGKTKKLIIRI